MSEFSTPKGKAQEGKRLMKEAVVDLLKSYGDIWLKRADIEEKLGLSSVYETDGRQSYTGALASMLLNELVQQGKIKGDVDGRAKIYRAR